MKLTIQYRELTFKDEQRYPEHRVMVYLERRLNAKLWRCSQQRALIEASGFLFSKKGMPDYCYVQNGQLKFVEIKCSSDGWKIPQIRWHISNPHAPLLLFCCRVVWRANRKEEMENARQFVMHSGGAP